MKIYSIAILCVACLAACGGGRAKKQVDPAPVRYGYTIVATHPHDTEAYTQGLFWHEGTLWESTGEYGHSRMRQVELSTGRTIRERALDDRFFGEGAALAAGRIYQLTWLGERGFVYDEALKPVGEFSYKGEGWGLATDGHVLYMSDGTANITVRDPATFAARRSIQVRENGRPVGYLNEMEWIDGRLWANVYLTNRIVIIDPTSGRVEGTIDFGGITSRLAITPTTDVMNGIAHDPATGRTWVTGKNWNKLFEIKIQPK